MSEGGSPGPELPAGVFSSWLQQMQAALAGPDGSDVPCGDCTGCCEASQFVHIGPDELDALAHIPAALLFAAPMMPPGHVLLGYDERGRCPMLVDGACSIYEHRPRTCRTYDCRVFPAAGVDLDEPDKEPVARRAKRWRFDHPTERDEVEHGAVQAAATFLREHRDQLPAEGRPATQTQLAVTAVMVHQAFVRVDPGDGSPRVRTPDLDEVGVLIRRGPAERGRPQ